MIIMNENNDSMCCVMSNVYGSGYLINRVMIVIIMRWCGGDRSQEVRHGISELRVIRSNKDHTMASVVIGAALKLTLNIMTSYFCADLC